MHLGWKSGSKSTAYSLQMHLGLKSDLLVPAGRTSGPDASGVNVQLNFGVKFGGLVVMQI